MRAMTSPFVIKVRVRPHLGELLVLINEGHDLALCDPGTAGHAAQARRLPLKGFPKQSK